MTIMVHVVYLMAGNFLMNGFLHLLMGLMGKKFARRPKTVSQSQYEKVYAGKLFSSAVFNSLYGIFQIVGALLMLVCVGSFRFGTTPETGFFFVGIVLGTVLLSWKYEGTIS